jgi:PhnB protein
MSDQTIYPYLCIRDAADAMEFYKKALGAVEVSRWADPDGKLRHGEFKVGNSMLMMHDESPEFPELRSVQAFNGSPVNLFAYVDNVDALYEQAVAAGAKALGPLEDKPYGRTAGVVDPYGLTWWLCSKPVSGPS